MKLLVILFLFKKITKHNGLNIFQNINNAIFEAIFGIFWILLAWDFKIFQTFKILFLLHDYLTAWKNQKKLMSHFWNPDFEQTNNRTDVQTDRDKFIGHFRARVRQRVCVCVCVCVCVLRPLLFSYRGSPRALKVHSKVW